MVPIWGEENAALGDGNTEYSFGNGGTPGLGFGFCLYVPSGFTCELVAMSISIRQGTATVEAIKNSTSLGSLADVTVSSGTNNTNDSFTPVVYSNGDILNFKTTVQSGTGGPNVITAWMKYTEN